MDFKAFIRAKSFQISLSRINAYLHGLFSLPHETVRVFPKGISKQAQNVNWMVLDLILAYFDVIVSTESNRTERTGTRLIFNVTITHTF